MQINRLTIGELARRAGLGVETIRFYERKGLLARPSRPVFGFRVYPEQAISVLTFLREAQDLGFTLREIKDLLGLRSNPGADAAAVRARATLKAAEIDERMGKLARSRAILRHLLATCPGRGALDKCSVMSALSRQTGGRRSRGHSARRKETVKTAELTIQGMHCDGCAKTIEALLKAEPGVKASTVSYADGRARVLYDPQAVDLPHVVSAVERAGYRVIRSA